MWVTSVDSDGFRGVVDVQKEGGVMVSHDAWGCEQVRCTQPPDEQDDLCVCASEDSA